MPSHDPQLRQIRASAGSGKTYELTTSFLKHLSGAAEAGGGPFSGCSAVHSGPHGWPEILAVTFTNRAAAEMQERIIGRLKDTALGTDKPAPGWTREQARRWVGIILRRYGALNVRTIDSLLHLIVRLTALELDLPPDFEPVFATDEAIAPLLDSLLEQSRLTAGGGMSERFFPFPAARFSRRRNTARTGHGTASSDHGDAIRHTRASL